MKLLGWMHRKFRNNSGEPLKDFITGQALLDDQHYYQKPGTKSFKQVHRDSFLRKSFAGLEAAKAEEDYYEEESAAAMSELFHGFLAIGTLGSEHANNDPATPTFAYSVEYITEKETEVTEDELKLINDELEKVLGAEARDSCYESSGRNSYVSAGRSSHGSTITLGGKSMEGQENGNLNVVCPLQEYLFGSAVELSEPPKVVKKEHRTSLGELFQKTKMTDENYGAKSEREERRSDKDSDKSVMHLMKKKLKKKVLHATSRSSTMAAGGSGDSNSTEAKLHKILHMFHKKVHPEYSTAEKETDKLQADEVKKKTHMNGHNTVNQVFPDEDIMIYPQRNFSKKSIRRIKSQSNPPHLMFGSNESDENINREFWIKTDADYLVLEL